MKIFFIDESGVSQDSPFFILGAVCIEENILKKINNDIGLIKSKNNIPPHVEIKWSLSDTNKQMRKAGLSDLNSLQHGTIKGELLDIICQYKVEDLSAMWYLSPREFFIQQKWRSYDHAMNIILKKCNDCLITKNNETGIVLIDELTGLGSTLPSGQVRQLLKTYVLNYQSQHINDSLSLIIPNVDSGLSFGHQLNDILVGLFGYYLGHIHGICKGDVSPYLKKICNNVKANFYGQNIGAFNAGINIYPKDPHRTDLKNLIQKTYTCLTRDFNFK